jgi:hypothetical protein
MSESRLPSGTPGSSSLRYSATLLLLAAVATGNVEAQISPGELSSAHANLEGMSNCTSCHTLGKTIANANCLACHTELRTRIGAGTGLHATNGQRPCTDCHKEHHGKDFSLIRFDKRSFDHSTTGYRLEGKHVSLDCERCHTREHITAADVRANSALMSSKTFLGLSRSCTSCHRDVHAGQLSQDCLTCHSYEGWKPVKGFNHDRARFTLTGRHLQVECAKCHKRPGGPETPMQFAKMEFSRCSSCHADPHGGRFTQPCDQCHATSGWKEGAARNFNHASTRFPLAGKHATVRCEQCHAPSNGPNGTRGSQTFHIVKFSQCNDCHADPHKGQFTRNPATSTCASCHTEAGWKEGKAKSFDHSTTKFPLRGRHGTVPCARCHTGAPPDNPRSTAGRADIKRFAACTDCHQDPHGGQFAKRKDRGACESCHDERAFSPSLFSIAEHASTRFPLTGSHGAVPCGRCHGKNGNGGIGSVIFAWKSDIRCGDCHKNVHQETFTGVSPEGCATCHTVDGWKTMIFTHDRTAFALTGKHVNLRCALCHGPGVAQSGASAVRWRFKGTPARCVDCHPQEPTPAPK